VARRIKVLTTHFVANGTRAGKYADGGGLFLQITETGSKSWLCRCVFQGRTRMIGLGSLARLDLAGARKLVGELWSDVQCGIDPYAAKELAKAEKARAVPFRDAAESYIKDHEAGWKNGGKSADQWRQTLRDHAFPTIGDKPVGQITTSDMVAILKPIWATKNPTAKKVRNRVELILDAEKAAGHRSGNNPAAWRGNLKAILPPSSKVHKKKSHPALDYERMPAFMEELRGRP
jgi:hypothetical protein